MQFRKATVHPTTSTGFTISARPAGPFYFFFSLLSLFCHSTDFNLRYPLETVAHLQGLQTQTVSEGTEVALKQGVDLEADPHHAQAQLGKQLANIVKTFK